MTTAQCRCLNTFVLLDSMEVFVEGYGAFAVECPKCKLHVYTIPKSWAKKRLTMK